MVKSKANLKTGANTGISERTRTVILVLLLLAGFAFIVWAENQYEANFIDSF